MDFELAAEARDTAGRVSSRRLRRAGKVPAIIYGGGDKPSSITLDHATLLHQMEHEAFFTSILSVKIGKQAQPVVVKDVQRHPSKPTLVHLDFQRIVADEEITLNVPIHFLNEDTAIGVKDQGGVVEHLMVDVEVTCLPKHLPEYLEMDVAEVELDQIVHLSDLKLPAGVTLDALEQGSDQPIFAIHEPRRVEEEPTEAPEAEAVEEPSEEEKPDEDS